MAGKELNAVKVIIIGAGASGLSAAHHLINKGIEDIIIVEAQSNIGGRICTIDHDEHHLELGAQWIHGEDKNVVFELASENGLVEEEPDINQTGYLGNYQFVRSDGYLVDPSMIEEFKDVTKKLQEEAHHEWASCPSSQSLADYFSTKYKNKNKCGEVEKELLDWYGRYQCVLDGSNNWNEVSARGQAQYHECDGNLVTNWKNGYRSLLHYFRKKIPRERIFLDSPVVKVAWDQFCKKRNKFYNIVTLVSGEIIEADHVICTVSLAVLKKHHQVMFKPQLPAEKINAIEGLGINVVDKIYIKFPRIWWEDSVEGFSFLPSSPSPHAPQQWEEHIVSFCKTVKQPDMLCAWITGDAAVAMERTPPKQVKERCVKFLRKRLSRYYDIPDANGVLSSAWASNPYIGGSYSYRSLTTEAMDAWPSHLSKPCLDQYNKPILCFAGEATHDHFYSTVHGAVETGRREADRIIQYINRYGRGE